MDYKKYNYWLEYFFKQLIIQQIKNTNYETAI